jgi:hypothetical protein
MSNVADPDQHHFGNPDLDPHPHQIKIRIWIRIIYVLNFTSHATELSRLLIIILKLSLKTRDSWFSVLGSALSWIWTIGRARIEMQRALHSIRTSDTRKPKWPSPLRKVFNVLKIQRWFFSSLERSSYENVCFNLVPDLD